MGLADHVNLVITTDAVGVARAGFGIPLVLSHNASFAARVEFVSDLAGVVALGFATDSPEYLAVAGLLSQNPHPSTIAIGRAALVPTQVYTVDVATVRNSHTYSIAVAGEGVTAETVTYTSDASATDGEIVVGLVAALNAVTGKNFTAAGSTSPFTVTGTAAGDWFSLSMDPADLLAKQTHADPGVATDLAAIAVENDSWYALITLYNSNALVKAAAAWIETQRKVYIADVAEGRACTVAVGGATDTCDDLHTLDYARTAPMYHPTPAEMAAARWFGKCLPKNPGSITWKFKQLSGLAATTLTATYRTNLVAKATNFVQEVAGVSITQEGTVSDGNFIDVIRGIDWLYSDMATEVFVAMTRADKVPYTDDGVAVIETEVRGSLKRGINRSVLANDPAPVVTVPVVADVPSADKAARNLPDVKWTATLAGAIHSTDISGVVSY